MTLIALAAAPAVADVMELLSGIKIEGKVTKIDKVAKEVTFAREVGGKLYERVYPYSKIHAVTLGDKRYVLTEKPAGSSSGSGSSTASSASGARRAPSDVQTLIDQQGSTPPDWFESTPLDYPQSLDLSWPEPGPKEWNNQRNMGQYIWDVINPNPDRWRGGVRLMHHLLTVHQDNPTLRTRVMRSLAGMYFRFFQDYARAAFWWQKAGVGKQDWESVQLAECYWRLGSKPQALEMINQNVIRIGMIKLLSDMGETEKALQLAQTWVRAGGEPHPAYLCAGDACRLAGRFPAAIDYYQKTLDTPPVPNKEKQAEHWRNRARSNLEAVRLFELCDVRRVADGAYSASSLGYAGDVHVEVSVHGGRIEAVQVTKHQEKQFYSALTDTPRQIVEKQGFKGVDAVSGATITSEAIINATAKALAKGAR